MKQVDRTEKTPPNWKDGFHSYDLNLSRKGVAIKPAPSALQHVGRLRRSIPPSLAERDWQPPRDTRA